jgi:ribose transport system permease protein
MEVLGNARGVIALLFVICLGIVFSPRSLQTGQSIFLQPGTQLDILFEYSEIGLLACGMTLVILTAGIDLSVGSVLGFTATFFSLLTIGYGMAAFPAILLTLGSGAVAGAISGVLVTTFRMQPFVATLAMMVAARGAAKVIAGGIKVQPGGREWYVLQDAQPKVFDWMTSPLPGIGLQPISVAFLLSVAILYIVVRYSAYGRTLYAVGGNEQAARLSGINVSLTKMIAYVICGVTAAMAGVADASRLGLGDPSEAGFTYELDAIAAVVIGGTSLMGGRGGMIFTFLGVLIIAYINKILSINNVAEAYRLLAKGGIIVAAVLIQQWRRKAD